MNNVVHFPISPLHERIRYKIWVTTRYTEACNLFDKWHTEYHVNESKFAKMMVNFYLIAIDKFGAELDRLGGAC